MRAFKEFGVKETFYKLFQQRQLKFGTLMGTDALGNKYYENKEEYPYGQHRWVEYANHRSFYDSDPTLVTPEWHVWLHCVTDDPPTATTIGTTHKFESQKSSTHSDAPYDGNLGGVVADYVNNRTMHRPRGYGIGNGINTEAGQTEFWTQPGWPMDPRHEHPKTEDMPSITDTDKDVLKLEAGPTFAAAGLTDEEEEFLSGNDPDDLEATVNKYDAMIKSYGASSIPEARAGVEEATRLRDDAASRLARYNQVQAKLEAAVTAGASS